MKTLQEVLESKGFVLTESRSLTPRGRALQQAKAMLRKLDGMKSVDELNSDSTTQNWWSPQPNEDQRRIAIRYGGATVTRTGTFVENTLEAVRDGINRMREAIEETSEEMWHEIQKQRDEEQAKRKKKAAS